MAVTDLQQRPHWFRFHPRAWVSSLNVTSLTLEERGVYLELLLIQFEHGELPEDVALMARLARAEDVERFMELAPPIIRKFFPGNKNEMMGECREAAWEAFLGRQQGREGEGREGGGSAPSN